MPEQNSESPRQSLTEASGIRVNWIIDPNRGLLLPLTGIWILVLDWLLFSSNALSAGLATPVIVAVGFILGGKGAIVTSAVTVLGLLFNLSTSQFLLNIQGNNKASVRPATLDVREQLSKENDLQQRIKMLNDLAVEYAPGTRLLTETDFQGDTRVPPP